MADRKPVIAFVVAAAENGVIGRKGRLPWRIPSELQHFRRVTMGKPLIMGRKTFASLKKPLDGRDNIVLTRSNDAVGFPGAELVGNPREAIEIARRCAEARGADEIMVIGGAEIYSLMLPDAERIYLTRIHACPDGDVYLPGLAENEWREHDVAFQHRGPRDDHDYTLSILERIRQER